MYSPEVNLEKTTDTLLAVLDKRSCDIMTRRYGLVSNEPETLESIGAEYGITRERVRQIQAQAKKVLLELGESLSPVSILFEQLFKNHGGIMAEDHVVQALQEQLSHDHARAAIIVFYLDVLEPYRFIVRHIHFAPHWQHPGLITEHSTGIVDAAQHALQHKRHPLVQDELFQQIRNHLTATSEMLPVNYIYAHLTASKLIDKTPFGEWGLIDWSETRPRGVGDKAYAVLRRHSKPEHFTKITDLINNASFNHKKANPQTVHNELIKDNRFVLVGRGLYGLTEWGYVPGTVADVIENLLRKAVTPLTREEVIAAVLAQRHVKKNTILLGLQNQDRFVRTPENRYTVRK